MSGIAAIIHFDGKPVAPGEIEAMTGAMAHRGPDGIRHMEKGAVALGHCMMCTTAESLEEVQPLVNSRGNVWLVVDGWLDNWQELRAEVLKHGAQLRNRSDAELILAAYELWGEDCVLHMGGDFAFVIWDEQRKTAFCARDRMGNKPLNYYRCGSTLVIASEVKAILALPWVPRVVNEGLLAERLAAEWLSRTETLWTNVLRLAASHRLKAARGEFSVGRYWQPDVAALIRYDSDEEYFDHYRSLLLEAVRRSARSHRTVAYEVSGGLDSSAVFCAAKHLYDARALPAPGVQAYTLDFSGDARADEVSYVRALSRFLGVHIPEIPPTMLPPSWYVKQARDSGEQPPLPHGPMALGLRLEAIRAGSRVTINGCGGDEWLAGSRSYYAEELAAGRLRHFASSLATDLKALGITATLSAVLRHGLFEVLPLKMQHRVRHAYRWSFGRIRTETWLPRKLRALLAERRLAAEPASPAATSLIQRNLLDQLHRDAFRDWSREAEDLVNSGVGLEARRPLDTPAIVEFAVATPERLRMRGVTTKFTHVNALRGLVPKEILARRDKAEFSSVVRKPLPQLEGWFKHIAASAFPQHLDAQGLRSLYTFSVDNPQTGWPLWVLWSIYGCLEPIRDNAG